MVIKGCACVCRGHQVCFSPTTPVTWCQIVSFPPFDLVSNCYVCTWHHQSPPLLCILSHLNRCDVGEQEKACVAHTHTHTCTHTPVTRAADLQVAPLLRPAPTTAVHPPGPTWPSAWKHIGVALQQQEWHDVAVRQRSCPHPPTSAAEVRPRTRDKYASAVQR